MFRATLILYLLTEERCCFCWYFLTLMLLKVCSLANDILKMLQDKHLLQFLVTSKWHKRGKYVSSFPRI